MVVVSSPAVDGFREMQFVLAAAFAVVSNGGLGSFTIDEDSECASSCSQQSSLEPSSSSQQSSDAFFSDISFAISLPEVFSQVSSEDIFSQAFADQSSFALHRDYVPSSQESEVSELLPHVAARNSPSSAWRCDGRNVQSISGESSSMTRHSNGPANEQGQCYFLEGDLDIINERSSRPANQRVLCDSSINLLQRAFLRNGRNVMSERFWTDMRDLQLQWIEKICTSSFERTAATSYTLDCWTILTKFFSMFRKRPLGVDRSVQFYVLDAIKFLELLALRGCDEVSSLLTKFVIAVVGRYIKKPERMNEMNPMWVQSREMLRIVCRSPTNIDALLEIIVALDEMESEFLKKMTNDRVDRNLKFICYAMEQMNDLVVKAKQRVQQCQQSVKFTLLF